MPRFLPRAETTVVDAYLTPALRTYVDRVARAVEGAPLWFMTSGDRLAGRWAWRGQPTLQAAARRWSAVT